MGEPLTSLLCLARFPTLPLPSAPALPQIQGTQHNSISGTLRARYDLSLLTQLTSTATETFPLGAQLAGAGKQGTEPSRALTLGPGLGCFTEHPMEPLNQSACGHLMERGYYKEDDWEVKTRLGSMKPPSERNI